MVHSIKILFYTLINKSENIFKIIVNLTLYTKSVLPLYSHFDVSSRIPVHVVVYSFEVRVVDVYIVYWKMCPVFAALSLTNYIDIK